MKLVKKPPTIEEIITSWKVDCSEVMVSPRGSTYTAIPRIDRRTLFLNLIKTLLHHGYEEDIKGAFLSTRIVKLCWPDVDRDCTAAELNGWKTRTRQLWEECIDELTHKKIEIIKHVDKAPAPAYVPPPKRPKQPKPARVFASEEVLMDEINNPKNRIVAEKKIERIMDFDLMKEMGIEIEGSDE